MSFTTAVALIAILDGFVIAAVAAVCLIPFALDRGPSLRASHEDRIELASPEPLAA